MKLSEGTTLHFNHEYISELFNQICEALYNIEKAEKENFDRWSYSCYTRDAKERHWYNLWMKFNGTYDEYMSKKFPYDNRDEDYKTCRAYIRMLKLHDIVADAITHHSDCSFNLSLSDHAFIEKCLTKNGKSYTFSNASLY